MGFLSDMFRGGPEEKAEVKWSQVPQTEGAIEARELIRGYATGDPSDVPLRGTAPLPEMTPIRDIARTTAKEMIQPQDIFALPEVQGIIQEAKMTGDLLTNRLGRMLQASGSLTSTPGRDILGRAVTDVQKNLASSLAPFASEERGRRASMIPLLESLGLTEELRKQRFTQAELDALFAQEYETSKQLETFTIPLLQSIISQQPGMQPFLQAKSPSTSSMFAGFLGQNLGNILGGIAGMGGAGGAGSGGGYNPGIAHKETAFPGSTFGR